MKIRNIDFNKCKELGIETNVTKRWEQGIRHHPRSVDLMNKISTADRLFGEDYFSWEIGGDGDNGESLMYLMDIIFELEDKV
jgi:hypothetical protein